MSYSDWRARLQEVVDDGLRELRAAQVIAGLSAEVARAGKGPRVAATPGPPAPASTGAGPGSDPGPDPVPDPVPDPGPVLIVPAPVLGVDGCSGGWVGVLLVPDGPARVLTSETIGALVDLARESADVAVVAIDIPIGLPDSGVRTADVLARKALPGKSSSVFTTLTRAAWAAGTRAEAEEINQRTSGRGVPPYTFALREKLLQVDDWVHARPQVRVVEVHPELCFAEMTGSPVLSKKRQPEGAADRRSALSDQGLTVPPYYAGTGFAEDDLLDACAAAWTAVRVVTGTARSLPEEPERFSDGIPAAIWV